MNRFLRAAVWVPLSTMWPLAAAAIEIEPSITVGEIYTSNVLLAPSGQEESEWITRIAPSIALDYEGSRLDLRADYTLEALFYVDVSDRNQSYHQLGTSAVADVLGEELQLAASGSISQVNIAPEAPVTSSNVNTTGNRTDAIRWEAGPRWNTGLFGSSELDGYLSVGRVNYDEPDAADDTPAVQDIKTTRGRASLHSDEDRSSTIGYDLVYEYDKLEYEVIGDTTVETSYLELSYRLNEGWRLFALGGLDNNIVNDESLSESRWEAGFAASFPSDTFRASAGHRYFGSTYSLNWDHVETDATYSLSYSERPTTSDLAAIRQIPTDVTGTPPDAETEPPPDSGIDRPGNPTRYIRKRVDADGAWTLFKSRLSVNLYYETRDNQVVVTGLDTVTPQLNDETSYGATVRFRWELGTRSTASVSGTWSNREFNDLLNSDAEQPVVVEDQLYTLLGSMNYALGLRTQLSFEAGYRSRKSSSADSLGNYDELWASAFLVRTF